MPTVREVTDSYTGVLIAVPAVQPGVCKVCRSATGPGFPTCFKCGEARQSLDSGCADVVVPISLSVKGAQWATDLARYKNTGMHGTDWIAARVGAVLWRFLDGHEACVARAAGVDQFDLVTSPPSQAGRVGEHRLDAVLSRVVLPTAGRYAALLLSGPGSTPERTFVSDRYVCEQDLTGKAILVVDDQWTTGSRAQSAAAALKAAGAQCVAVLALGRHVDPSSTRAGNAEFVAEHAKSPFNWDDCAVHR